jgi:TonB family protein
VCGSIAKRWLAVWVALALMAPSVRARGQPPSQAPEVVPPRLKADPGVTYPQRALNEHFTETVAVDLVLDIDASGGVQKVSVTEPRGHGLDEAAVDAAQRLVFDPATRDGRPVASRIRFRYEFKPPPPRLTGRVATQATDRPIAGASVVVRDADNVEHGAVTAADGTWSVLGLPRGRIHIVVTLEGREPQAADEDLSPGEETSVVLRLAPARTPLAVDAEPDGGEAVEEVTVRGTRPPREVTKRTLEAQEIARIPGTNGDALRSLQNLPGVGLAPVFSGQIIVRGSAPQDTNVFVDGTNIPLVYHFGGLSSVVPTELIDKIDFYPGNFSAAYGRGMGGVVDVGVRAPKTDGFHGVAQADLIDTRLLVEGPIAGGWSFLAAGRRSWFDVWLGPILSRFATVSVAPRYYDYQLMVRKDFSPHSSFRVLFFGSDDELDLINSTQLGGSNPNASLPPFSGALSYSTSFWRLQARYENKFSSYTELRVTGAYGQDSVNQTAGPNTTITTMRPLSARAELSQKLARGITANLGLDLVYEPYDLDLQLPPATQPGIPPGGPGQVSIQSRASGSLFLPAAYAELELVPWKGARIVPGVRADYDSATRAWDIAPRVTLRQDIVSDYPRTTVKAGAGLFDQPPTVLQADPRYGQTGLVSSRSQHYDVGFEQEFTRQIELSTDLFYKAMDELVVAGSRDSGDGNAYGVEWLLRYKPDEHFFGWLSYTLSRSERRNAPGQPAYLFQYDQTHILTVLGSYKLGRGWQVGARFRLVSGNPYTPTVDGAYDATVGSQQGVAAFPPNGARLPFFQQLDLRIDKTWAFRAWKLSAYVDVQNVYVASNPVALAYSYNFTQSAYVNGLPILPILGLRAEF